MANHNKSAGSLQSALKVLRVIDGPFCYAYNALNLTPDTFEVWWAIMDETTHKQGWTYESASHLAGKNYTRTYNLKPCTENCTLSFSPCW